MRILFILCVVATFLAVSLQTVRCEELPGEEGIYVLYTTEELEGLVAPIALYPDPLIAQILPAATFFDQVHEAANFVRQYGRSSAIDTQPWDVSVKALAHYPDVLFMMDQDQDWTMSLGEAFVKQQAEVMNAIQTLRIEAREAGNLVSTSQMQVTEDEGYIRIYPAEPERIYIPVYDPDVVYYEPAYPSYSLISFGIGFSIGSWLNRDCDWHGGRIYYHGWRGGGWIRRSRPHVHVQNNIYVNNRHRDISINRRMYFGERYRNQIRTAPDIRRRLPGRTVPGVSAPDGRGRTIAPAPGSRGRTVAPAPGSRTPRDTIRTQPRQPAGSGGSGRGGQRGSGGQGRRQNLSAPVTPATPVPRVIPAVPVTPVQPPTKVLPHRVPEPPRPTLPQQAPLRQQAPLPPSEPIRPAEIPRSDRQFTPAIPATPDTLYQGGAGGRRR